MIRTLIAASGIVEMPMIIFNGWLADKKLTSRLNQLALYSLFIGTTSLLCAIISGSSGKLENEPKYYMCFRRISTTASKRGQFPK